MEIGDERVARYLRSVISEFYADNDITRALRRLHIKEVHLTRRGNQNGIKMVKRARRLI